MEFKPELMREILLFLEALPAGEIFNGQFRFDGYTQPEINLHAQILLEEGYLMNPLLQKDHLGMPHLFVVRGLTMKAHEFLANTRNNTIWKKVMAEAKAKGMSTSMTVLNGLAQALAKKYAGLE